MLIDTNILLVGILVQLLTWLLFHKEFEELERSKRERKSLEKQSQFYEAYRKKTRNHPILTDPHAVVHALLKHILDGTTYPNQGSEWNVDTPGNYFLDNWCEFVVGEHLPEKGLDENTAHEAGKKILDTRCHSCVHRMSHFALGNCIEFKHTYEDKYSPSNYYLQSHKKERGTDDREQTEKEQEGLQTEEQED